MPCSFFSKPTMIKRSSLDMTQKRPPEMENYLANYGWHFNKKASDYAAKCMRRRNGSLITKVEAMSKDEVEQLMKKHGVTLENDVMYDKVYVANMCKADLWGSSIADDMHMAKYIKDVCDDVDAGDGTIMRRWYAGMVAVGMPVDWEDLL